MDMGRRRGDIQLSPSQVDCLVEAETLSASFGKVAESTSTKSNKSVDASLSPSEQYAPLSLCRNHFL